MNFTGNSTDNYFVYLKIQSSGAFRFLTNPLFIPLPLFFLITSILIFPIYAYMFHWNRDKDRATAVFPIVDHFYHVVMTVLITILVGAFLLAFEILLSTKFPSWELLGILNSLCTLLYFVIFGFTMVAVQQVQYFLHFLLALQRFLLYFYPGTEKYVNLTEKSMKRVIKVLYAISICINIGTMFCEEFSLVFQDIIKFMLILFLNMLLLISVILYLSIMISVRKLTNLESAIQNKPQRYIFYQAFLLLIARISTVLYSVVLFFNHENLSLERILKLFLYGLFFEFIAIPFTIQVSYLFCNRRNVKAMFSTINVFNWCRSGRRSAQVQPGHQHQTYLDSTHV